MSIEQLKAKLNEAREKYNQIVAATQAQGENVKEIEQKIKVLNQMVDKAKQSKTTLHSEIERLAKEKKNKTKQLQRASDTKCQLLQDEIEKVEKGVAEKEQIYLTLQIRYKILRERWERQENEYLSKIYELEQTYSQIKAKTNEVIGRIQGMSPIRRPGILFNPVPDVFPDITNLFSPTNIEDEFNSSGSGDETFELELEPDDQENENTDNYSPNNPSNKYSYDNQFSSNATENNENDNNHNSKSSNSNFKFPNQNNSFNSSTAFLNGSTNGDTNSNNIGNEFIEDDDEDAIIGEISTIDDNEEDEEDLENGQDGLFVLNDIKNHNTNYSLQDSIEAFFQQQGNKLSNNNGSNANLNGNNNEYMNHLNENAQVHNLTEKVTQLSLQERKLTLEKLKLECRLLQHKRDDLINELNKKT